MMTSSLSVPIDMRELSVTPVFKYVTREDVNASERAGHAVMRTDEVVEVRIAGQRHYAPQFPVTAQWKRDGHRIITYAERWPEQYREFVAGGQQMAQGTPLEMLRPYGITEALLSLCRALKIYSIEALASLEGDGIKNLGMHSNTLKDMARKYMAQNRDAAADNSRIAELEAQIAALKAALPQNSPGPDDADMAMAKADDEREALKARYADLTGARPRGNPSVETLRTMVAEAEG